MKKFMKIMALGMAMALTFGMTVCAAPSTSTKDSNVNSDVLASQAEAANSAAVTQEVTVNGQTVTAVTAVTALPVATYDSAVDAKASVASAQGIVAAFDLNLADATGATLAVSNASIKFPVPGVKSGSSYVILHFANGAWEQIIPSKVEDGYLTASFSSLSPVAVVEVAADNGSDSGSDDGNTTTETTAAAADTTVSPKTGETLPVAGVMAVICLAGAAVCAAKKVRYND